MRTLGIAACMVAWCTGCITTRTGLFVSDLRVVDDHLVVVSCDTRREVAYVVGERFDDIAQRGCIIEHLALPAVAPVEVTP